MRILNDIYKKIAGRDFSPKDPYEKSMIDEDAIREYATDAMVFSEMYLSDSLFVQVAVINNNGAFFFVPTGDLFSAAKAKEKAGSIREYFSLNGGNSFVFFANETDSYLYDDREEDIIELSDLQESFQTLYDNLLLPYVDVQYIGFNGIEDLLIPAEELIHEDEESPEDENEFEFNGERFSINDEDDCIYSGEPEYVKYLLNTEKAEKVCAACAKIEHNDKPEANTYTYDEGITYILRHSEQRIGGKNGVNTGLVGHKKWYRVSDDDTNKLVIMAIFGGWLGLHKLYQGQIKDAIIYFLTCGCLGILPMIDVFMMLTGNYSYSEVDYYEDEMKVLHRSKSKIYMRKPDNRILAFLGIFISFGMAFFVSHTLYQTLYVTLSSAVWNKGTNMSPDEAETLYNRLMSFSDNPLFSFMK